MTEDPPASPALLPAGLRDLLPPDAETEAASVAALMAVFASHGYQRVKPPLLEFEESLFAGSGAAVADQTFRLMDPDSQRMMGVRADTTPQVARIATTRLAAAARPLRLSYAGQCLLVRGSQLAPDRQIAQAGIELIGVDAPQADAELVLVAAEALAAVGLTRISFDFTLPTLVPVLLAEAGLPQAQRRSLLRALDRKDATAVREHGGPLAATLNDLLLAAGAADGALAALAAADLPPAARALSVRLADDVAAIRARAPELKLTVDPIEFRGMRYHTGVCMTVFAPGRYEELGRGGRYLCGDTEPATGLTLYPDAILRSALKPPARRRVFVPLSADPQAAATLRREGYATVAALSADEDAHQAARHLSCTYVFEDGALSAIEDGALNPLRE
jgi:ATP phosphoribosyltransferase regulatory subunit